jgi:hypothetical protein
MSVSRSGRSIPGRTPDTRSTADWVWRNKGTPPPYTWRATQHASPHALLPPLHTDFSHRKLEFMPRWIQIMFVLGKAAKDPWLLRGFPSKSSFQYFSILILHKSFRCLIFLTRQRIVAGMIFASEVLSLTQQLAGHTEQKFLLQKVKKHLKKRIIN